MDLTIRCDAKVNLVGLVSLLDVSILISEYFLEGNSLDGSVEIKGKYIKDNLVEEYDFSEKVPFTVVFKEQIEKIDSIEINDFIYNEVINNGIECKFNILIDYIPVLEEVEEINDEVDEINSDNDFELISSVEEEIKDDINKKYDKLINEVLEARDDNFLDDTIDEKNVSVTYRKATPKPSFNNIPSSYTKYRIYYPKEESEIEAICNKEKIGIDNIYKEKANKDFKSKKRIIIK